MLEASYNRNIKITYDIPYQTHRNLLPGLANVKPLRIILAKRLLTFVEKIRKSDKAVLRSMLRLVEQDANTVTGRNLRTTLLLTYTASVEQLRPEDSDNVSYYGEPDLWRVLCIAEIMQMRAGEIDLPPDWEKSEIEAILESACVN